MTRPGDRLRRLALRLCSPTTIERVIDPTLVDLRIEYANAWRAGRPWRARWLYASAVVRLIQLMATAVSGQWCAALLDVGGRRSDRARAVLASALVAFVLTGLLLAVVLIHYPGKRSWLGLLLLPSTLPISIPCALAAGIARMRTIDRRAGVRVLLAGLCVTAVTAVAMCWFVPEANQRFRVVVYETYMASAGATAPAPPPRGFNELTFPDLRRQVIRSDSPSRPLMFAYHLRLAASAIPLVLTAFMLSMARYGPRTRTLTAAFACVAYFAAYGLVPRDAFAALPPALLAWLPNLTLATVAVAIRATVPPGEA